MKAPGTRVAPDNASFTPAANASASVTTFRRAGAGLAVLFGFHAVREVLRRNRREIFDLYATPAAAERLGPEIAARALKPKLVEAETLSRRLGANAVHQGVMIEVRPLPDLDISEIASNSGLILVLDQITDPHNVGAILRTAAAFAVDALVTTDRHAPEMTGVLAKAASGGLEHVSIVSVVNLARTLKKLGEMGYCRIGLDSSGPVALTEAQIARPVALVLGGEGKGIRRLTRENCDLVVRLDMPGAIKSLNVSNACAVALAMLQTRPPQ
ncbi:23S rRNA (guanosine(2251)-2'-O)-methyltransferase RlmB [Methylocapsa palsarum]|uniref:23S rRNA (Guanosine2251-2'-O)-methyltransferase n=1 Tax=Methylocapsa palsarum TaxID=1612308 RepID=A0A1I4C563_9HYPH|nr:23S rRNA (guanosine(2251)-2'-O)-methyltransferase RlmB [Methylocapsa palsarum]SFK75527.1 23S rRNA (guanosine2251-2'-O)-methyltransferase [Methylocapsa palsarum]